MSLSSYIHTHSHAKARRIACSSPRQQGELSLVKNITQQISMLFLNEILDQVPFSKVRRYSPYGNLNVKTAFKS